VNVALIQLAFKMANLVDFVNNEFVTKKISCIRDWVILSLCTTKLKRVESQNFFKGVVIKKRYWKYKLTIRKMSGAVGVERIFPVNLSFTKVEINKRYVELEFSTSDNLLVRKQNKDKRR
jgi:large subunit ribosomal protein L19